MKIKILSFFLLFNLLNFADAKIVESIFVIVNEDIILKSEFNKTYGEIVRELKKANQPLRKGIKGELLRSLINDKIMSQKAKENDIVVSDIEIDQEIENLKRMNYLTDELFEEQLKREGKTLKELKEGYGKHILNQKVMNMEIARIVKEPSSEDVRKFYKSNKKEMVEPARYRVKHILIKDRTDISLTARAKLKEKLRRIRSRILKGEKFEALAKKYSEDSASRELSGDLGFISKGSMMPEFEQAVFSLKKGEISPVFTTRWGFHIAKITNTRKKRTLPLDEVKLRIKNILKQKYIQEEFIKWMDEQWELVFIKINLQDREYIYKVKKWVSADGKSILSNEKFFKKIK